MRYAKYMGIPQFMADQELSEHIEIAFAIWSIDDSHGKLDAEEHEQN